MTKANIAHSSYIGPGINFFQCPVQFCSDLPKDISSAASNDWITFDWKFIEKYQRSPKDGMGEWIHE